MKNLNHYKFNIRTLWPLTLKVISYKFNQLFKTGVNALNIKHQSKGTNSSCGIVST